MKSYAKASKVQLVGGLGNQLFCYSFGRYLESCKNHDVIFDTSEIDRGFTRHGVSLETLDLPGTFENIREQRGRFPYWMRRISFAVQSRIPVLKAPAFLWPCYTAVEVGWDAQHEASPKGNTFRGYFASTKYFEWLAQNGLDFNLELKNPSKLYLANREALKSESFLSIHVRRGDYVGLSDLYGLVGRGYFLEGMRTLRRAGATWSKIVVFSDDVAAARELLESLFQGEDVLFLDPPQESDPAESMALMTLASSHIISNSSFSLWGALLADSPGQVVVPQPWHKGMETPKELLPESWIKIDSDFI